MYLRFSGRLAGSHVWVRTVLILSDSDSGSDEFALEPLAFAAFAQTLRQPAPGYRFSGKLIYFEKRYSRSQNFNSSRRKFCTFLASHRRKRHFLIRIFFCVNPTLYKFLDKPVINFPQKKKTILREIHTYDHTKRKDIKLRCLLVTYILEGNGELNIGPPRQSAHVFCGANKQL